MFTFVTDGIEAALAQAREAGGAHTVNQHLAAGLVDELRLHVTPVVLGRGERLLDGVGALALEQVGEVSGTDLVTHLRYRVAR
ncbi:MAG TPA: dihydrofolate reductase family protein [Jatrophihabitantaceae bacterium]|nr:dihydrofolate reductase family protein [Jatrophihabitantaceae bacterium]